MKRSDITTCLENGIENFEDGEQLCNPPFDGWMDKGVTLVKHDGFLTVCFEGDSEILAIDEANPRETAEQALREYRGGAGPPRTHHHEQESYDAGRH